MKTAGTSEDIFRFHGATREAKYVGANDFKLLSAKVDSEAPFLHLCCRVYAQGYF